MFESKIEIINKKFEDIKEEVNDGKVLLFAEWEVENLIIEVKELIPLAKNSSSLGNLKVLLKQLTNYLSDIQCLIENDNSSSL